MPKEKAPKIFEKFEIERCPTVIFTRTDKKILKKFEDEDAGIILDSLGTVAEEQKAWFEAEKVVWHAKIKKILNYLSIPKTMSGCCHK